MAGLRCDGTEKDPEEDSLKCTLFNESEQGDSCPTSDKYSESKSNPIKNNVSIISQNTESDVNLELKSISKEDDGSTTISNLTFSNTSYCIHFIKNDFIFQLRRILTQNP